MKRIYPRTAWFLSPSFKPTEVTVVRAYRYNTATLDYGDENEKGRLYYLKDLHATKEIAVAVGYGRIRVMQDGIAKLQESIDKKIASLEKAMERAK